LIDPRVRACAVGQLLYHNAASRSGFAVMIGDTAFIQCWTSVDAVSADVNSSSADSARFKTCYTAGVAHLPGPRHVSVTDLYSTEVSATVTESSFFGVVKLSP